MSRHFAITSFVALALVTFPVLASAEETALSVNRAQFTNKVDAGKPTGDAASIAAGQFATYWLEVKNPAEATQVTLVWKLDGVESGKQTLDVGRSPSWRTWGSWPTRTAHAIEVQVLDKDGHALRTDTLAVEAK